MQAAVKVHLKGTNAARVCGCTDVLSSLKQTLVSIQVSVLYTGEIKEVKRSLRRYEI
jgi:hypothetical protein